MKTSETFFWCLIGFAVFAVGGALRMYIQIRARGLTGLTIRDSVVMDSYRTLVREGRAPLWPLPLSYVFILLGISIVFGSILVGKK